jgi:hypothetical protein
MNLAKSTGFGIVSGIVLVIIALLSAFVYVWLNPAGGDSWDAGYFFTHPALFIIIYYQLHFWIRLDIDQITQKCKLTHYLRHGTLA